MKLDLKGWQKVSEHSDHTILKNEGKGHELKILHAKLHPAQRGQLAALKMAGGGQVPEPNKKNAQEVQQGATQSGWQPEKWKANLKSAVGLAQGGEVRQANPKLEQSKQTPVNDELDSRISRNKQALDRSESAESPEAKQSALSGAAYAQGGPAATRAVPPPQFSNPTQPNKPPKPHYAEGDIVSDEPTPEELQTIDLNAQAAAQAPEAQPMPPMEAPPQAPAGVMGVSEGSGVPMGAPAPEMAPEAAQTPVAGGAPAPKIPAGDLPAPQAAVPDQMAGMEKSLQQAQAGMTAEGAALAAQSAEQQKILHEQQKISQAAQASFAKHFQELDQERQALRADIAAGHINPSHFVDNMSGASKIATAIGLIAAGMGAGLTGGENLAAKFFHQQIENDIQAQKANLGAKENLLSANLKQFGNMKDAEDMYRLQRADMLSQQMLESAAKAQGPIAQARLQQEAAKLQLQYAPLQQKIAQNKTISAMVQSVKADPTQAQAIADAVAQADPEKGKDLKERLVPGMGFANTHQDATDMKALNADAAAAKQGIARLKEINKVTGASASPSLRAEAFSISRGLVGQLNRAFTGGGPMSEHEQKMLQSIARNPTELFSLGSSNKVALDTLSKTLDGKVKAIAESKGLTVPDPAKKLPPEQQKIVEYARRHPELPQSKIWLEKLGIE